MVKTIGSLFLCPGKLQGVGFRRMMVKETIEIITCDSIKFQILVFVRGNTTIHLWTTKPEWGR